MRVNHHSQEIPSIKPRPQRPQNRSPRLPHLLNVLPEGQERPQARLHPVSTLYRLPPTHFVMLDCVSFTKYIEGLAQKVCQ